MDNPMRSIFGKSHVLVKSHSTNIELRCIAYMSLNMGMGYVHDPLAFSRLGRKECYMWGSFKHAVNQAGQTAAEINQAAEKEQFDEEQERIRAMETGAEISTPDLRRERLADAIKLLRVNGFNDVADVMEVE